MSPDTLPLDLTACPQCDKAPLAFDTDHYRCNACRSEFPGVGDIPWLFAAPEAKLGEWRGRLHFALQQLAKESAQIATELKDEMLLPLTAQRLNAHKEAIDEHRSLLRELLAPIDMQSLQASHESYLALRTRLPTDQGIATYYNNVHRDWAWGEEENVASLEQIRAVTGTDFNFGKTLVLGAGAGRLAYDIHMQLGPEVSVAMDFNPLLLFAAKNVMSGTPQSLYEFPLAPKTIEDIAVRRELTAPEKVRDNFHLVFGDALRPPFAKAAFDTVVTPWLIDIVSDDLAPQAQRVNQLLKTGGNWINFGSVAFTHARRARCYSKEELLSIVAANGFATPQTSEQKIPYMCSPASRHGRLETVFSFAATKSSDATASDRHKALPDWIVTGKEAVPLLPAFQNQAMSTRIYAFIMSLIDGKRSIADMAKIFEEQKIMSAQEAIPAIRTFMTRMHDDAEKGIGL